MKIENLKTFNFEGAIRGMRNPRNSWHKSDSWSGFFDFRGDEADYEMAHNWVDNENDIRKELNKEPFELGSLEYNCVWDKYLEWIDNNMILSTTEDLCDVFIFGPKDLELAQKLIRAGSEHRKFLRQIFISFDLTAPLYFWKEFDTYKIGTVVNSTSTMHKLASTPITLDCFETDDYERDLIYLEGIDDSGDYPFNYSLSIKDIVEAEGFNTYHEPTIIQFLEELRLKYLETKDKKYWKELIRWLPESWLQTRTITMNYENVLNIIHQRNNHKLSEWNWLIEQFKKLPYSYELLYSNINTEDINEN